MKTDRLQRSILKWFSNDTPQMPTSVYGCNTLLRQCTSIISNTLSLLIENNVIEICRNNRAGRTIINRLRNTAQIYDSPTLTLKNLYICSLLDSTEMIMEISRNISSTSGLPLWHRYELDILRQYITEERSVHAKSFITGLIGEHLKDMDENSRYNRKPAYQYLRLLQNIYTAIICIRKL